MSLKKNQIKKLSLLNAILSSLILIILLVLIVLGVMKKDATDIFKSAYESIVEIRVTEGEDIGYGSGVIISADGKIVTNSHVVIYEENNPFDKIEVRLSYEEGYREVNLIKYDEYGDLALLQLNDVKVKNIKINNKYTYGDQVYAIGNGSNYGISITEGIISNPKLTVELSNKSIVAIQCDLTISEGNSGGALLDNKGRLIGITTFRLKDSGNKVIQGISYSIPIDTIKEFIK